MGVGVRNYFFQKKAALVFRTQLFYESVVRSFHIQMTVVKNFIFIEILPKLKANKNGSFNLASSLFMSSIYLKH